MKRIMKAFRKKLLDEDVDKVKEEFETFYTSNNRSFARLADVYAKKFNKCQMRMKTDTCIFIK